MVGYLPSTMGDGPDANHSNYSYRYACHNATLAEIFSHLKLYFPEAKILTLEGGHCKKPPMIRHFPANPRGEPGYDQLASLPNINVFIMRGAWNIMRNVQHWSTLSQALPELREWHCGYAKPKPATYDTIGKVLPVLPSNLVHVNVCLDGFYNKEMSPSRWFSSTIFPEHLCRLMGEFCPFLESLSFTGKICHGMFQNRSAKTTTSKLKSLDIMIKSCCREQGLYPSYPLLGDVAGITSRTFINSFEKIVRGAVRSLAWHPNLEYVRIRYIDLDSPCPLLNPYFQLANGQCTGFWSPDILDSLRESRPSAQFVNLSEGIYPQYGPTRQIIGAVYPQTRPTSIQASAYRVIADVSKA